MKKQVLIISYAYPPNNVAGAQRPYALAKYLDKSKYNIKVITCSNPDLPLGENKDFIPQLEGVEVIKIKSRIGSSVDTLRNKGGISKKTTSLGRLKSMLFKVGQKLLFPDKGMFWTPEVKSFLKSNKDLIKSTDYIFSTSPGVSNHQIAQYIKKHNKSIDWIADFRDFNYVDNGQYQSGLKATMHKKLELSIISNATVFTFVTKTMQQSYKSFYPKYKDKMHCVYNGLEKSDFSLLNSRKEVIDNEKINIFYAGTFYNGLRSPFPLLHLLDKAFDKRLLSQGKVLIQIAGNIDESTKNEMSKFKSYECVDFLGSIPRSDVLRYMTSSTFQWLIVGNIKSHYQTVPIKLFEYIAARRPIINFAPSISEPSQIIEEYKLGINFNTLEFDLEESYIKFENLILQYNKGIYSSPMSDDSLDAFSWENQINMIEQIMSM